MGLTFNRGEEAALLALRDGREVPAFAREHLPALTRQGLATVAEDGDMGRVVLTSKGFEAANGVARTVAGLG